MNANRKVYDSDLRAADDYAGRFSLLREVAHAYCREYVGNFELMIEARSLFAKDGKLPDGLYRSVLNTLRTDPMRQDLWGAVASLLFVPTPAGGVVVPFQRPPHREYGGHRAPEPRRRATYMVVRVVWKVPFLTADRAPHAPVVHLFLKECEGRWWRPRTAGPDWDLDMDKPLEVFEVKARTYCKSWGVRGQLFRERPTYDQAFPGGFEPGGALMPFCRTCARLYLENPDAAVYRGEVQ